MNTLYKDIEINGIKYVVEVVKSNSFLPMPTVNRCNTAPVKEESRYSVTFYSKRKCWFKNKKGKYLFFCIMPLNEDFVHLIKCASKEFYSKYIKEQEKEQMEIDRLNKWDGKIEID